MAYLAIQLALGALLLAACVTDLRARRIPNAIPLAVLSLFAVSLILVPTMREAAPEHLLSGLVAFVAGFALFAARAMGGGDVKLFAALALFYTLGTLRDLALATAVLGGLLALAYMGRTLIVRRGSGLALAEARRVKLPYGLAIAGGHLVCVLT